MTPEWTIYQEQVENYISYKEFHKVWARTTICLLTLKNWFEIVGVSHVHDARNYDQQIWELTAYQNAFDKLVDFVSFDLKNQEASDSQIVKDVLVPNHTEEEWK